MRLHKEKNGLETQSGQEKDNSGNWTEKIICQAEVTERAEQLLA